MRDDGFTSEQELAAQLSDEAMLAELVKRGRLRVEMKVEMTAAEKTVARLDSYTQEQHQQGIEAARERAAAKRAARRERAQRAAHELQAKANREAMEARYAASLQQGWQVKS